MKHFNLLAMLSSVLLTAGTARFSIAADLLDPLSLEKFVDPLPNPLNNLLSPVGMVDGQRQYEVSIGQFTQRLHRDLAPTTLWGYNGTFPGPTFVSQRDEAISVRWTNRLTGADGRPLDHILPYDSTVHGAGDHLPQARTVAHLHGGITEVKSDGYPQHWVTPDAAAAPNGLGGPAGNSISTTYHNRQPATALWYHDHAMGSTRLNVYAGMAGFYLLRDQAEQALNLPSGAYEIPLMIQDRSFYQDGQLFYPAGPGDLVNPGGGTPLEGLPSPFPGETSVVPHFLANTNLVNGVVWPYLDVEPGKYRFRLLNGANARFYELNLDGPGGQQLPFQQIGTDGGLLTRPVQRDSVVLAPADRADVVVDFSGLSVGDHVLMRNIASDDFSMHDHAPADPNTTGQVMQFRVVAPQGPGSGTLPGSLINFDRLSEGEAATARHLSLVEQIDHHGRPVLLLDGKHFSDPITEVANLGTTEIWTIENFTSTPHPIHLHASQFQLLDRTHRRTGPIPLGEWELGWEDTIVVNPGERVRAIVPFEQFAGTYVWHCHILEHEDHEMMRPLTIIPEPPTIALALAATAFAFVAYSRRLRSWRLR